MICQKVPRSYVARAEALEAELGKKPPRTEAIVKAAIPPLQIALKEFEELAPPKGEEQKAEAFIEAMREGVEGLEQKPSSKLSGPGSPFEEFGNLTRAYGLRFCSTL